MDPYIEGPLWTTFHFTLAAEFVRQLGPKLHPRYLVLPVERFVVDLFEDLAITRTDVIPDVSVIDPWPQAPLEPGGADTVVVAPLRVATVMPSPTPHVTLEIRDAAQRELVTAIEILSPTNKRGQGREEYLEKRLRLLQSRAHLMEIDLLRAGIRVPMQQPLPPAPYFVFLSRADQRPMTEVWPIYLNQYLPTVSVPLLPGDPDIVLDLQAAVAATYELLRYDLAIDYTKSPAIPLEGEAKTWVEQRLYAAGLLPTNASASN
jgi:hypothetical protein